MATKPKAKVGTAEPVAWAVVNKDGAFARTLIGGLSWSHNKSGDLVADADSVWPSNAPHRQIPLYATPHPAPSDYDKLVERSFGAMTIADAEYVPSEEMITAYLRAQHQYCHEADQRGEVEYSRKACVAGLKAALRSRN